MYVEGTGSWCVVEECVKDNYYTRFHTHCAITAAENAFFFRLEVYFLDDVNFDHVSAA